MSTQEHKTVRAFIGFLSGIAFTFVVGTAVMLAVRDYPSRLQTAQFMSEFKNSMVTSDIEQKILNGNSIKAGELKILSDQLIQELKLSLSYINERGEVFIVLGIEEQFLWLVPQVNEDSIEWFCTGGSDDDITNECRKTPEELHKMFYKLSQSS